MTVDPLSLAGSLLFSPYTPTGPAKPVGTGTETTEKSRNRREWKEQRTEGQWRVGTASLTASHSSLHLMPSAFGSGLMLHG